MLQAWFNWAGDQVNVTGGGAGTSKFTLLVTIDTVRICDNDSQNSTDAVFIAILTATGTLPNTHTTRTFSHTNYWTPIPLARAALRDPEVKVNYDAQTDRFTVTAKRGNSAWTWIREIPRT